MTTDSTRMSWSRPTTNTLGRLRSAAPGRYCRCRFRQAQYRPPLHVDRGGPVRRGRVQHARAVLSDRTQVVFRSRSGASKSIVVAVSPAATITATAPSAAAGSRSAAASSRSAAACAAGSPGPGFIDGEPSTVVVLTVQCLDRGQGFVVIRHFDEPEATTASGLPVAQDLSRAYSSVRSNNS